MITTREFLESWQREDYESGTDTAGLSETPAAPSFLTPPPQVRRGRCWACGDTRRLGQMGLCGACYRRSEERRKMKELKAV